jgi:hypothetical protein
MRLFLASLCMLAVSALPHVDLVWYSPSVLDRAWIYNVLLRNTAIRTDTVYNGSTLPSILQRAAEGKTIVISTDTRAPILAMLSALDHRFSLFHLGDEIYKHDIRVYDNVTGVIVRPYYSPAIASRYPKAIFTPLGYGKAYNASVEAARPPSLRRYGWMFVGELKSTRGAMVEAMNRVGGREAYTRYTHSFASEDVRPAQMAAIMANTVFCPCPRGWWNKESYRIGEALEAGCIPIVEDDHYTPPKPADEHSTPYYFRRVFGSHPPFPVVDTWAEATTIVRNHFRSRGLLEQAQARVMRWWERVKERLASQIADALDC